MSEWNDILIQLDKERIKRTTGRWTTAQGLKLENEFSDADAVPYGKQVDPDTNKPSVSTITKQVRKKRVSNKPKKDRIAQGGLVYSAVDNMEMSSMMTSRSTAKPKTRTAYAPTMQPFAPRYGHRSSLFTLIG